MQEICQLMAGKLELMGLNCRILARNFDCHFQVDVCKWLKFLGRYHNLIPSIYSARMALHMEYKIEYHDLLPRMDNTIGTPREGSPAI